MARRSVFFFKQKTAYEMRISDWSSDVCSSDPSGIGAAIQEGTVSATTSVSRNGNISITGGTVRLGPDSTLRITPDTSAEVIPQGADSVANFKTSKITIGGDRKSTRLNSSH